MNNNIVTPNRDALLFFGSWIAREKEKELARNAATKRTVTSHRVLPSSLHPPPSPSSIPNSGYALARAAMSDELWFVDDGSSTQPLTSGDNLSLATFNHPRSLFACIPPQFAVLVSYRVTLSIAVVLLLAFHAAVTILLFAIGRYNWRCFTFVSYMLVGISLILIGLGLWLEGWTEALIALVYMPVIFGDVVLVAVIISIVIAMNPTVMFNPTSEASGLGWLRDGDWTVHGVPIVDMFVLLLFGYLLYNRAVLRLFLKSVTWQIGVLYLCYFYVAPLIPIGIYALCVNPLKIYPTSLNAWQATVIVLVLNFVVQSFWLWALSQRIVTYKRLPNFHRLFGWGRDNAADE